MVEDKKTLYIGLAAAGIALGAAVLWYNWSAPKPKSIADKLKEAKLTEVKKGDNGQLDQTYFLSLL